MFCVFFATKKAKNLTFAFKLYSFFLLTIENTYIYSNPWGWKVVRFLQSYYCRLLNHATLYEGQSKDNTF